MNRIGFVVTVVAGLFLGPSLAWACPIFTSTFRQEVAPAAGVLHVRLISSCRKPDDSGKDDAGETRFQILSVLKSHPLLKGQTEVKYPRYLSVSKPGDTPEFIVLFDVDKKKQIDLYRGITVYSQAKVDYFKGIVNLDARDPRKALRFFFSYLNHADTELAKDAFSEFSLADYADLRAVARELPAGKIEGWMKDPNTPGYCLGLYASMLGHCGSDQHAALFRQLLDGPERPNGRSDEGLLTGYVMLKPKEGWEHLNAILQDKSKDFMQRYAAQRSCRFFWDSRPDIVSKKQVVDAVMQLLDHEDIADLAIDDLRRWEQWDVTERVLALAEKKSHDLPIMRRSILRFALCGQAKNKSAAEYVEKIRMTDAAYVKENEELLELEKASQKKNEPPSS